MKNKLFILVFIFSIITSNLVFAQMQWGDAEPDWLEEAKRKAALNHAKENAWVRKAYAKSLGVEDYEDEEIEEEDSSEEIIVTPAQKNNKEFMQIGDEKIEILLVEE